MVSHKEASSMECVSTSVRPSAREMQFMVVGHKRERHYKITCTASAEFELQGWICEAQAWAELDEVMLFLAYQCKILYRILY